MQFIEYTYRLDETEQTSDEKPSRFFRSDSEQKIRDAIEEFNQSYQGHVMAALKSISTEKLDFLLATDGYFDCQTMRDKLFESMGASGQCFNQEEVTLQSFFDAFLHGNGRPNDTFLEEMGIDELVKSPALHEEMVPVFYDSGKSWDLDFCAKFSEEVARIRMGTLDKECNGHPISYIINSDDEEFHRAVVLRLAEELYDADRIESGRVTFVNVDAVRRFDIFKQAFSAAESGVLVIQLFGSEIGSKKAADIAKLVNQNMQNVQIILGFAKDNVSVRNAVLQSVDTRSFLRLQEGSLTKSQLKPVFEKMAKSNRIATDHDLYNRLNDGVQYSKPEAEGIFAGWQNEKLVKKSYPQYCEVLEAEPDKVVSSAREELQSMIGLDAVKNMVDETINFFKAQKLYEKNGIVDVCPSMHMVFTGNPGTAKTTVARLLSQILKDEGILRTGTFLEVGRGDLVGKFVGWTAPTVAKKFQEASGGVLFIDEAYSLVDETNHSFGDEAIDAIVQEMENHRDDVIVIFAGYPDPMNEFISRNPGLRSRIARHIQFDDYSADELCEITCMQASRKGFSFTDEAKNKIRLVMEDARQKPEFGNGRFARNIFEKACFAQANRLMNKSTGDISTQDVRTLAVEDLRDFDTVTSISNASKTTPSFKIGFAG